MSRRSPATHYDILGIARAATAEQVRRAYRRLARELHPDVNPAADAASRFAAVQNAYSVLSDRRKRAKYDETLAAAAALHTPDPGTPHYSWRNVAADASPGPGMPRQRTDLDEMYDAFFGGPPS